MNRAVTKDQLLEDSGYYYNFERALYVNRSAKKAFSLEFVQDNTDDRIRTCIEDSINGKGWRFYFNRQPSDYVKSELERVLTG
jgi:hypothetical protein